MYVGCMSPSLIANCSVVDLDPDMPVDLELSSAAPVPESEERHNESGAFIILAFSA